MQRRWLLPIAIVGGLVWIVVSPARRAGPRDVQRASPAGPSAESADGALPVPSVPRQPLAPTVARQQAAPTARETLAAYWGREWPRIEAELEAEGRALDVPFVLEPWETAAAVFAAEMPLRPAQVEAHVGEIVRWPAALGADGLRRMLELPSSLELSEVDLAAAERIAAPFNARLEDLGRLWADGLEQRQLEAWNREDYERVPFGTTTGSPAPRGFHSLVSAGHGWTVSLVLRSEDCPELMRIADQAHLERESRSLALRRALAR